MQAQPENVQTVIGTGLHDREVAQRRLPSPAAWSQFAWWPAAWLLAMLVTRRLRPALSRLLTPPGGQDGAIASARRRVLIVLPLLMPLLACGLTGMSRSVTRSLIGSGEVTPSASGWSCSSARGSLCARSWPTRSSRCRGGSS